MIVLVLVHTVYVVERGIERHIDIFIKFTEVQPREQNIRGQYEQKVLLLEDLGEATRFQRVVDCTVGAGKEVKCEHFLSSLVIVY